MIVSFLEGKSKQVLTPNDCKQVGMQVARMHQITKDFKVNRNNNLSVSHGEVYSLYKRSVCKINKIFQTIEQLN